MLLEFSYTFECLDGFKYTRNTPEEIIEVFNDTLTALQSDEKKGIISALSHTDATVKDYFVSGQITFLCGGKFMLYVLGTKVTKIER